MDNYQTKADLIRANEAIGGHFFAPEAMTFFDSRISTGPIGGHYFVTSEKQPRWMGGTGRRYTIRSIHRGAITTVGEFQGFSSLAAAIREARALARDENERKGRGQ